MGFFTWLKSLPVRKVGPEYDKALEEIDTLLNDMYGPESDFIPKRISYDELYNEAFERIREIQRKDKLKKRFYQDDNWNYAVGTYKSDQFDKEYVHEKYFDHWNDAMNTVINKLHETQSKKERSMKLNFMNLSQIRDAFSEIEHLVWRHFPSITHHDEMIGKIEKGIKLLAKTDSEKDVPRFISWEDMPKWCNYRMVFADGTHEKWEFYPNFIIGTSLAKYLEKRPDVVKPCAHCGCKLIDVQHTACGKEMLCRSCGVKGMETSWNFRHTETK